MSQESFQGALVFLVIDPDFRQRVMEEGEDALGGDLTPQERHRIASAARDQGLDAMRLVHKGFRLGKLLTMLPMTCALLGTEGLTREVGLFWRNRPPRGFYFAEEAIAFCEHLQNRLISGLEVPNLAEIMAYELARIDKARRKAEAAHCALTSRFD